MKESNNELKLELNKSKDFDLLNQSQDFLEKSDVELQSNMQAYMDNFGEEAFGEANKKTTSPKLEKHLQNSEKLDKKRDDVKDHAPEPMDWEILEKEKESTRQGFPKSLLKTIEEVQSWSKLKKETSEPVKRLSKKLLDAKDDETAAVYMGQLLSACVNYLNINENRYFKSSERKKTVRNMLIAMAEFGAVADMTYLDKIKSVSAEIKKDKNIDQYYIKGFEGELNNSFKKVLFTNTLDDAYKKRKKQSDEAGEPVVIESLESTAKDILLERESDEFKRKANVPVEEKNATRYKFENLYAEIEIPDINRMSDYELLSNKKLRTMRRDVLRPLIDSVNGRVAFPTAGYEKELEFIKEVKSFAGRLRVALDLYDARLHAIAGEQGAKEKLEKTLGYNKTQDEIQEIAEKAFDDRMEDSIKEFKAIYKSIHGKEPSKALIEARKPQIERNISKKKYLDRQFKIASDENDMPREWYKGEDAGLFRVMKTVVAPGRTTITERVEKQDEKGNVTTTFEEKEWNKERAKKLVDDMQSNDTSVKFSAYRQVLDHLLHVDLTVFSKMGSEAEMVLSYGKKLEILLPMMEAKNFLTSFVEKDYKALSEEDKKKVEALGFPMSKEDRAKLLAISDVCLGIHHTIDAMRRSLSEEGAEYIEEEDFENIKSQKTRDLFDKLNEQGEDKYKDDYQKKAHKIIREKREGKDHLDSPAAIKIGSNLTTLINDATFRFYYDDMAGVIYSNKIQNVLDQRTKDPEKKFTVKEKTGEEDMKKARAYIRELSVPITSLSRKKLLDDMDIYRKAMAECEAMESYYKKVNAPIPKEDAELLDGFKKAYDARDLYLELYGKLVSGGGIRQLHERGLRLSTDDKLLPNVTKKEIDELRKKVQTDQEVESLDILEQLLIVWDQMKEMDPAFATESKQYEAEEIEKVLTAEELNKLKEQEEEEARKRAANDEEKEKSRQEIIERFDKKNKHIEKLEDQVLKEEKQKQEEREKNLPEEVKNKLKNSRELTKKVDEVKDAKVKLRFELDMNIKKELDFLTLKKLSDFAYLTGGGEELAKLANSYIQNRQVNKIRRTEDPGEATMELMTEVLLSYDISKLDVSTDEAIANNATELEKASRALETYKDFYARTKGYGAALSDEKKQALSDKLEKLSAITGYYRTRRLLMEEEIFINHTGEPISTEEKPGDDYTMKRVRQLIAASADKKQKLQNAMSGQPGLFLSTMSEEKKVADEAYKALAEEESRLHYMEEERYLAAPEWMRHAFSLTKQKDTHDNKDVIFGNLMGGVGNLSVYNEHIVPGKLGKSKFRKKFWEVRNGQKGGIWSQNPKFDGGHDKYLEKLTISDNWNRVGTHVTGPLTYRHSDGEMEELIRYIDIQNSKQWDEIKKDPKQVAFYESAYKDQVMQLEASYYAAAKRVTDTMALKGLVMHPIDLAMQSTPEIYSAILGAVGISNIDTGDDNMNYVNRLFKENNKDGRYIFDGDKFRLYGNLSGNLSWKFINFANEAIRDNVISEKRSEMGLDVDEFKSIFGMTPKEMDAAIKKEVKEAKKQGDPAVNLLSPEMFYMYKHPEFFDRKVLMSKTDGKYVFEDAIAESNKTMYVDSTIRAYKEVLDNNLLPKLDEKELADYEKSLKKRNMPKLFKIEGDPYGSKAYHDHMEMFYVKDEKGNPVMDKKKGLPKVKEGPQFD